MQSETKHRCMVSTKILYKVVNKKNIDDEDYEVLVDFIAKLLTADDQIYFDMFYQYFVIYPCFHVSDETTRFYSVIDNRQNHPTDYLYFTSNADRAFTEALEGEVNNTQLLVLDIKKSDEYPLLNISSIIDCVLKSKYSSYRKEELLQILGNNLYLGVAEMSRLKCLKYISLGDNNGR